MEKYPAMLRTYGDSSPLVRSRYLVQCRDILLSDTHFQGKSEFSRTHRQIRRPFKARVTPPAMAESDFGPWGHGEACWAQRIALILSGQVHVHRHLTMARVAAMSLETMPMLGRRSLYTLPVVLIVWRLHRCTHTEECETGARKTRPNALQNQKLCSAQGGVPKNTRAHDSIRRRRLATSDKIQHVSGQLLCTEPSPTKWPSTLHTSEGQPRPRRHHSAPN